MVSLGLSVDEVLTTTRAVRRRLDLERPLDRSLVLECLEAAVQAPSGSNSQGWHFVVVTDSHTRSALAEVYREAFADYRAARAGSTSDDRVFASAAYLAENLQRVPCLVIPVTRGRAERMDSAHRQAIFWGGVVPATWSFMLAARERGLGTAWTTMHLTREREVAAILGIPFDRYTQVALIPVAHTIGDRFRPAPRRPLSDVVHFDHW